MLLNQEYFIFHNLISKMMPSCYSGFFTQKDNHKKAILSYEENGYVFWDLSSTSKMASGIRPRQLKKFEHTKCSEVLSWIHSKGYKPNDYIMGYWENSSGVPNNENEIESQNKLEMEAYRRFVEKSLFSDAHLFFRRDLLFKSLVDGCRANEIYDSWSPKRNQAGYHQSFYGGYYESSYYKLYPSVQRLEESFDEIDKSIALDWIIWQECFLKEDNNSFIAPELYFDSLWDFDKNEEIPLEIESLTIEVIAKMIKKASINQFFNPRMTEMDNWHLD